MNFAKCKFLWSLKSFKNCRWILPKNLTTPRNFIKLLKVLNELSFRKSGNSPKIIWNSSHRSNPISKIKVKFPRGHYIPSNIFTRHLTSKTKTWWKKVKSENEKTLCQEKTLNNLKSFLNFSRIIVRNFSSGSDLLFGDPVFLILDFYCIRM
jgi:hypothetical protein